MIRVNKPLKPKRITSFMPLRDLLLGPGTIYFIVNGGKGSKSFSKTNCHRSAKNKFRKQFPSEKIIKFKKL